MSWLDRLQGVDKADCRCLIVLWVKCNVDDNEVTVGFWFYYVQAEGIFTDVGKRSCSLFTVEEGMEVLDLGSISFVKSVFLEKANIGSHFGQC